MVAYSKIFQIIGILLLLHAAYSLQHYRALIKEVEESTTGISFSDIDDTSIINILPIDVWLEMFIAFIILLLSELTRTGSSLQSVKGIKQKPLMAPPYITRDFDIYSTRARGLVK